MVRHLLSELRHLPGADERQEGVDTRGLYPTLLGESWFDLAEPVRGAHPEDRALRARGSLRVEHGSHLLARLIARALGLPQAATAAETHLVITPGPHGGRWCERWRRTIGRQTFESRQYDAGSGELAEYFRLLEFRFRLQTSGGSLLFRQVCVCLRLGSTCWRLPRICSPTVEACEEPAGAGRTHIRVRVVAPLVGQVIAYAGTMEFEDA